MSYVDMPSEIEKGSLESFLTKCAKEMPNIKDQYKEDVGQFLKKSFLFNDRLVECETLCAPSNPGANINMLRLQEVCKKGYPAAMLAYTNLCYSNNQKSNSEICLQELLSDGTIKRYVTDEQKEIALVLLKKGSTKDVLVSDMLWDKRVQQKCSLVDKRNASAIARRINFPREAGFGMMLFPCGQVAWNKKYKARLTVRGVGALKGMQQ